MDKQLNMFAALGPQPLPDTWQDKNTGRERQVEWGRWEPPMRMFICPPPPPSCCPGCGSQADRSIAMGKVMPLAETVESAEVVTLNSGRQYLKPTKVPAWPVIRLFAFRCPDCFHTEIWDKEDPDA